MDNIIQFEIDGIEYKTIKLNAKQQFHLVRKLSPIFTELYNIYNTGDEDNEQKLVKLVGCLNILSDEHIDYIIDLCCHNMQRKQEGTGIWQKIMVNNNFVFEDIDFYGMLLITTKVISGNLSSFFQKHLSQI